MNENTNLNPLEGLPPELAELDRELADLRIAERPSFAPELESELGREWLMRARWRSGRGMWRGAVAASVTALLFAGLAVPPARASLVQRIQQIFEAFQEPGTEVARPGTPRLPDASVLGAPAANGMEPVERPAARRSDPVRETRSAGQPLTEFPDFRAPESTYPTLVDLESDRILMRRYYPPELQREGVGGTVGLLLWVDSTGAVDNVQMARSSGVSALDRAALQAAPSLRFHPTTRSGKPVGSWVEFPLVFEPLDDDVVGPLPEVLPVADPTAGDVEWELGRDWTEASVVPAPIRLEAQQLLRAALGQPEADLERRFGPLDGLLAGDPPAGASPLRWRAEASEALERAMMRDPDNPAPYLALARIRRKQGLREDARLLLGAGLDRARKGTRPISDRMAAELAFEYGRALKEEWLPWRDLGRLPVAALDGRSCPRRAGPSGDVDPEILIAWNYLCSVPLGAALADGFEPVSGGEDERRAMISSWHDAVTVYPGHVGANVQLLLDLADRGAWTQLLNQARRFSRATQGHPYARLLAGLALHRLGRAEEAIFELRQGIEGLDDETRAAFLDVRPLVPAGQTTPDARTFWTGLDPLLSTEVNERELEHLGRAAYAFLRFGELDGDAAHVWLRYGRPLRVHAFGGSGGLRTEFWDYGEGPDVTFTRAARSEEYGLTTEASAYLEDLARIFPHGLGSGAPSRSVGTLPAQVGRFRALTEGWVELEVALAIPEALRAGAAPGDSLDLGLFLLDADDVVLGEVRDRVGVRDGTVRWALPAAPEAGRLVVELYNQRNHQAAARSLVLNDETSPAGRVSDVLLMDVERVADTPFRRSADRIAPLARTDRLDGDRIGLAFEVYDVAGGGDTYRLRVELEAQDGSGAFALAFRPAGESEFRTQWTREPVSAESAELAVDAVTRPVVDGGRVLEVLTLDLGSVPPGLYTVRAVVELSDGHEVARERTELRRRLAPGDQDGDEVEGLERIDWDRP